MEVPSGRPWTWVATTCVALALFLQAGIATAADLDRVVEFHIPAGKLADALIEFSKQAHVQILSAGDRAARATTNGVSGAMSIREALNTLLKASGLHFRSTSDDTIAIEAGAGGTTRTGIGSATSSSLTAQERQADSERPANESSVEEHDKQASARKAAQLEEVVVTGSRIPTAAGDLTVPLHVYVRADIEHSGQTTVADFLNTLPDVSTSYRQDGSLTGIPGLSTVQLHGLPVGTTLTLLDGHRLEQNGTFGLVDLSNIPISAVERIEVLPVGASAIYGADALAGAVNVILRRDFNGLEIDGVVSHASGLIDKGADLAWGKAWDRGSMSVMGIYQDRGQLLGRDRVPTANVVWPVSLASISNFGDCAPGNVFTLDGSNLPGLNSPQAAIPAGITGRPTVQEFVATSGQQNQCNSARNRTLLPTSTNVGALISAHYRISDAVDLFTQSLFSHTIRSNTLGLAIDVPVYDSAVLAAGNSYNPFGEDVGVSFSYPGIAAPRETSIESLVRPLVGVRGIFFSDWNYEVTSYLSQTRLNAAIPGINLGGVLNALASTDPATALNPFTTAAPGPAGLLQSITAIDPGSSYDLNEADQIVSAQALLRGRVLSLPAGPAQAAVGVDYSREKQDAYINVYGVPVQSLLQRKNYAIFAETRVPILGEDGSQSAGRVALTLAGRYDHSNDFGGKATWQSGLMWKALETLTFTGSYGISYQAPTLQELASPVVTQTGPTGTVDPFRGNQAVPATALIVGGPNPNLKPETGNALTLGLTYSAPSLDGLRASLTYYKLAISNYIATHSLQDLIDSPGLFPGAIVRAPPTAQDQQQGFLGQIIQFNDVYYNFGDLHVRGVDADVRYVLEIGRGRLTPSLALAYVGQWQSALTANSPAVKYVSQANASLAGGGGWAPRWKGTAALAWERGPISLNVAGRYGKRSISRLSDYRAERQ